MIRNYGVSSPWERGYMCAAPINTNSADFWLVYSDDNQSQTLADAIHALYYLPENYKLMIMSNKLGIDTSKYDGLSERIQCQTGSAENASPFSFSYAVISDKHDSTPERTARITVSDTASEPLHDNTAYDFIVSANNPLAIASAALRLGRAQVSYV